MLIDALFTAGIWLKRCPLATIDHLCDDSKRIGISILGYIIILHEVLRRKSVDVLLRVGWMNNYVTAAMETGLQSTCCLFSECLSGLNLQRRLHVECDNFDKQHACYCGCCNFFELVGRWLPQTVLKINDPRGTRGHNFESSYKFRNLWRCEQCDGLSLSLTTLRYAGHAKWLWVLMV